MANRRRNHFIPRFLLNRFASRREGKKSWIWQVARGGDAVEVSTRDAAVATAFYGGPETGVEDAFAESETEFARVLAGIDKGEPLSNHVESLRQFVWTLAIRTRALREHFSRLTKEFTEEFVKSAGSTDAQDALARHIRSGFLEAMEREVSKLPEKQRTLVMASFSTPEAREEMLKEVEGLMRSPLPQLVFGHFRDMLDVQGTLDEATEGGQIKGLAQLLEGKKAPESFSPRSWQLYKVEVEMIFGDGCIVATTAEGRVGSLLQGPVPNASWQTLYLPISRSTVLVAGKEEPNSLLQPEDINRASAELSSSHIYSSVLTESIQSLAPLIGSRSPILSAQEVSDIVAGSWGKQGY